MVQPRARTSHKGDFGHVLVVAGSRGKTGAAHLAAMGALRSGAGLVTVATPRSCQPMVAAMGAEYMTEALDETPAGTVAAAPLDRVLELAGRRRSPSGPGLGTGAGDRARSCAALLERASVPARARRRRAERLRRRPAALGGPRRAATSSSRRIRARWRGCGQSTERGAGDRVGTPARSRPPHRVHVVLKGHRTVIATPDGRAFVNPTGNPGMATGGTGDVLTGMIAAWLGAVARRRGGLPARRSTCTAPPATWPRPTRARCAMTAGDLVGTSATRCSS